MKMTMNILSLQEGDQEPFKELSVAIGLLGWLSWELGIDVRAAAQPDGLLDQEQEAPWYPIQILAAVVPVLIADEEAEEPRQEDESAENAQDAQRLER